MRFRKLPAILVLATSLVLGVYGLHMMYNQVSDSNGDMIVDDSGKPISAVTELANDNKNVKLDKVSKSSKDDIKFSENNLRECYNRAKAKSNNVIGWLYVYGTAVNYPVMSGQSNNYWLTRSWTGKPSSSGSIFLDESEYTFGHEDIIHGHNMANGSMFASLRRFKDGEFFNKEHLVYLYDGTQTRVYRVFSVFLVPQTFAFKVNISDKEGIKSYARELYNKSIFKSVQPNANDLLILNTCVSDGTGRHQITVAQRVK